MGKEMSEIQIDMKSVWKALDKIKDPMIRAFIEKALQDQALRGKGCEMCRSLCKFCKADNLDICDECKEHSKFVPREHENFCSNCGRDLRKLV